ncbi:ABC transporter ATP-binding protein [Enterococcus sp. LJL90]
MEKEKLIRVENVYKSFGEVHAVNGLDFSIEEGKIVAFLGHNGAGKTTTLRLLIGLLAADQGAISVFGLDPIQNGQAVRKICGVLSEDDGLYEPLSVYDNLIYFADIYGLPRAVAEQRIEELLKKFDLYQVMDSQVKGFSRGMKKKVALIRAMLHQPRLLLLDEPTNGLDPVMTQELREMLMILAKESGATIVMTTHNLDEVQKMCDQIIIFRHGKNVFSSDIDSLAQEKLYQENGQFSLEKLYLTLEGGGIK